MVDIAPLCPLRYTTADLSRVVAPPYDVIDDAERAVLRARSPHNVVRLILPDGDEQVKHANAAKLLGEWRDSGVLARDPTAAFYRYQQTFVAPAGGAPRTRSGFLALVRAAPFGEGAVLPHERTLSGPKEDRLKLFRATGANLSPGFMLYRDPEHTLDAALDASAPVASFTTSDGVAHELGRISDATAIAQIVAHLRTQTLLIADGHHRYETAVRYAAEVDAARADASLAARPEHRYFMALLCNADDDGLLVCATHRLVHSLPQFSWPSFLASVQRDFVARPLEGELDAWNAALDAQRQRATAFVAIAGAVPTGTPRAVLLTLRTSVDLEAHPAMSARPKVVRRVGVAVLHALILENLLGVTLEQQERKTRVAYVQDPAAGVQALARGDGQVLFLLNATEVAEVRAVAQAGEVMPQKSTYFYPKVLTGLAIHTLDPTRSVPLVDVTA